MPGHRKITFLTLGLAFCFFIASASAANSFSLSWSSPGYGQTIQHALDVLGNITFHGSASTFGITNFLYAVNTTSGQEIWHYNTSIPVNYVSHFKYNTTLEAIIAGAGGSSSLLGISYVLAKSPSNATLWKTTNLNSSVTSVASIESNVTGHEDVIAGLANGTLLRLSGSDGSIQRRNVCDESVYAVIGMQDGSIIVGSSQTLPSVSSHVYRFENNLTQKWSVPFSFALTVVTQLGNTDTVVVAVRDGKIHVLDVLTGQEASPWPFSDPAGKIVTDLLAAQDYSGDGLADIIASTNDGALMIVNGQNATLLKGPQIVATANVYYIQYMYFYESGKTYLNRTLAVSGVDSGPPFAYSIRGINATTLTAMKQYNTSALAFNLANVQRSSSLYTGDLIFTVNNFLSGNHTVFDLSGTDIVVPEFTSNLILISLLISMWCLMLILHRGLKSKRSIMTAL